MAQGPAHAARIGVREPWRTRGRSARASRVGSTSPVFNSGAHIAGVSVSATKPEIVTDTAIVIANCRYISPTSPPRNATGRNTAFSTSTIAMTGRLTSAIARRVASRALTCSSRMCRSTFSSTTIASSTTMPIASTMPNSVRELIEKPSRYMPANVPTSDTGTATDGMTVARRL